jgi:uncharacterized NAD(P)/FAD-binding protein YdhS
LISVFRYAFHILAASGSETVTTASSRTIAIVGGGFSGTVLAAHLLRLSYWKPLRVVLVDRVRIGRGAAYTESGYPYLLNVPAGRMSATSRDPMEFLKFARRTLPDATADDFLPRSLFGEYLESFLLEAEKSCPPHVSLERVHGEVQSIGPLGLSHAWQLDLADGRAVIADEVVLALGNPSPQRPPGAEALIAAGLYEENPWASPPAFKPRQTVLVMGTGLTMADAAIAGADAAGEQLKIHAISRHGLIPPSQTSFRVRESRCDGDSGALLRAASVSARRLLRAVRELAQSEERDGGDWREAVTFVRNLAPALWQRLSTRERRRFLRHARTYWDIHRHRLPQQTLAALEQLRLCGKLEVHAGRIAGLERVEGRVRVEWRPRGSREMRTLLVDRVINCTGPDYNPRRSRDPLLVSLLSEGVVSADALGLGLRTGPNGALIDARGRTARDLYYLGPMLRADHWESTAAQELRAHAERLAHHLTAPAAVGRLVAARLPQPIRYGSIA